MQNILNRLLPVIAAAALTGCATAPFMPLSDQAGKPEASQPIYLMKVQIKNTYKERWQPRVLNVVLSKPAAGGKLEHRVFRMDDQGKVDATNDNESTTYLVRFQGGDSFSTLSGMNTMGSAFPVHGFYFVPMHAPLGSDAPGTYYLGSVQAIIRERKDNEFRAGPVIPLIDQAVAGASTGTFDIQYADAYEQDVPLFKSKFPTIKDTTVIKKILPPWDRARAQSEWEKN